MYIDLDSVIIGALDEIAGYSGRIGFKLFSVFDDRHSPPPIMLTGSFGTLGTEGFKNERRSGGLNSSIMIWQDGAYDSIWAELSDNFEHVSKITYKFDHWLEMVMNTKADRLQELFPQQICGYGDIESRDKLLGHRLITFPLSPKPWDVSDDWVLDNWTRLCEEDLATNKDA
jgi:hypothetical protein